MDSRRRNTKITLVAILAILVGGAVFLAIRLIQSQGDLSVSMGQTCNADADCSGPNEICAFNQCRSTVGISCGSPSANTVIDFEQMAAASAEGAPISNQFQSTTGISFSNGGKVTYEGWTNENQTYRTYGDCTTEFPVLAKAGNPVTAFSSGGEGNGQDDRLIASQRPSVGEGFLTDDGTSVDNLRVFCQLIIDFYYPTKEFSFDILDIDGGERYVAQVFGRYNSLLFVNNNISTGGNARRTPVTINPPNDADIYQIRLTAYVPKTTGWGLAFDNFRPFCIQENVEADIEKTNSSEDNPVTTDRTVTYTVRARNIGSVAITNYSITDTLPAGIDPAWVNAASISNGGTFNAAGKTIRWTGINLTVDGDAVRTYTVTFPDNITGTFVNTAELFNENNGSVAEDDSTVVVEALQTSLTIEKTNNFNGTSRDVAYSIVVRNTGQTTVNNYSVLDDYPETIDPDWIDEDSITLNGTHNATEGNIAWDIATLAPGASITFAYTVNFPDTAFGTFRNIAYLRDDSDEQIGDDDSTLTLEDPGAEINKSNSYNSTTRVATYTITVNNTSSTAFQGLRVTDTLPNNLTTSWVGNISNGGNLTGNTIVWTGLNLAGGATLQLTYTVTFPISAAGTFRNVVLLEDSSGEDIDTDDSELTVVEQGQPGAQVEKTSSYDSSTRVATYRITTTNTGSLALTGLTVIDTLPTTIQNSWIRNISNSGSLSGTTITWSNVSLAIGQSVQFTYTVTFPSSASGTFENVVIVRDSSGDPLDEDSSTITVTTPPVVTPPPNTPPPAAPLPDTGLLDENPGLILIAFVLIVAGLVVYRFDIGKSYSSILVSGVKGWFDDLRLSHMPYEERMVESSRKKKERK